MTPRRWILLRGLAREAGHWGPFLDRFRAAFADAAIDTIDLPGCGVFHEESAPSSVARLLADVRARASADRSPAWLFGLSLGGMVACAWMREHPDEIAGVVLVSSSAGGLSVPWRRLQPAGAAGLARAAVAGGDEAREREVFGVTSARPALAGTTVAAWAALARQHPVRLRNAAALLLAGARFTLPASAPAPRPSLVLVGGADRLVHPACGRALARALAAPVREHPTAGHDLPLDEPEWVVREVRTWLDRATA